MDRPGTVPRCVFECYAPVPKITMTCSAEATAAVVYELASYRSPNPSFLRGGGNAGRVLRDLRWEATALGAPQSWSPSLKSVVRFMLAARQPVFIFWGPDHICLHNDGFSEFSDQNAPYVVIGQPGRDAWRASWSTIGPLLDSVIHEGKSWIENDPGSIDNDDLATSHWQYRYQPIPDPVAPRGVGGVLVA